MKKNPKKIAIIGLPGSGKSTFANKLGKILMLPVHHLDKYMFEGKEKRDKKSFLAIKESILKEDAWIIEGCSFSTLDMRFACADTVIYFDFSRLLCIWRVCKRFLVQDQQMIETGCLNGVNWILIKYIWNFRQEKDQDIKKLCKRYPNVDFIVFHHSKETDNYLKQF